MSQTRSGAESVVVSTLPRRNYRPYTSPTELALWGTLDASERDYGFFCTPTKQIRRAWVATRETDIEAMIVSIFAGDDGDSTTLQEARA